MTKLDELRKAIEKSSRTQIFAKSLLFDDSKYFIIYTFGQSKSSSSQALAVLDAIEKAGVRQTLRADEKELLAGIICNAFVESLKSKVNGTIARTSKFFELLEEAMKENREFSEIVESYLTDVMMEPVKLVVDDNHTLVKIAMWIVVRSVMIPITPIKADSKNVATQPKKDDTESPDKGVQVSTDENGKVVIDGEYVELPIEEDAPQKAESVKPTEPEEPKSTANDSHNDAMIVKAVAALRELNIPDEKICDTLGITAIPTNEGGTIKASTSYRDTGEEVRKDTAKTESNDAWFIRDTSNTYHDASHSQVIAPLRPTCGVSDSGSRKEPNAVSRYFAAQVDEFKKNNPSDDKVVDIPVDFAGSLLGIIFGSLD